MASRSFDDKSLLRVQSVASSTCIAVFLATVVVIVYSCTLSLVFNSPPAWLSEPFGIFVTAAPEIYFFGVLVTWAAIVAHEAPDRKPPEQRSSNDG